MLRRRTELVGRKIICNKCGVKTVKGAARVMRKLVFFFCPKCWANRDACEALMREIAGVKTAKQEAA